MRNCERQQVEKLPNLFALTVGRKTNILIQVVGMQVFFFQG